MTWLRLEDICMKGRNVKGKIANPRPKKLKTSFLGAVKTNNGDYATFKLKTVKQNQS